MGDGGGGGLRGQEGGARCKREEGGGGGGEGRTGKSGGGPSKEQGVVRPQGGERGARCSQATWRWPTKVTTVRPCRLTWPTAVANRNGHRAPEDGCARPGKEATFREPAAHLLLGSATALGCHQARLARLSGLFAAIRPVCLGPVGQGPVGQRLFLVLHGYQAGGSAP